MYILRLLHFYRAMLCLRVIMLSSSVRLSVRPSVCLSVTSRYCSQTTRRNQLGFAVEASFHLSHTTRISKNYGTSLWGFVPDSGLRKFRHGKSIALSTTLVVVVDGRACWRHLCDNRRVEAFYYKSINCNPLTPLLRFVVDLLYNNNLFLWWTTFQLTLARRAVRLR